MRGDEQRPTAGHYGSEYVPKRYEGAHAAANGSSGLAQVFIAGLSFSTHNSRGRAGTDLRVASALDVGFWSSDYATLRAALYSF